MKSIEEALAAVDAARNVIDMARFHGRPVTTDMRNAFHEAQDEHWEALHPLNEDHLNILSEDE